MDHGAEISSQARSKKKQHKERRGERREDERKTAEDLLNHTIQLRTTMASTSFVSTLLALSAVSCTADVSGKQKIAYLGPVPGRPDPERILPSFRAWVEIRGVGNAIRDAAQVPSLVLIGAPLMSVTSCTFLPYLFSNSTRPTQLRRTTVPHSSSLPRSAGECPT